MSYHQTVTCTFYRWYQSIYFMCCIFFNYFSEDDSKWSVCYCEITQMLGLYPLFQCGILFFSSTIKQVFIESSFAPELWTSCARLPPGFLCDQPCIICIAFLLHMCANQILFNGQQHEFNYQTVCWIKKTPDILVFNCLCSWEPNVCVLVSLNVYLKGC